VTAVYIREKPLAYRLAHEIKYITVFVRDAEFLSPSGADKTDSRAIHRATDRHAACQRTATANMDTFSILRAGAFVTSLAGVVHASPSIVLSPTQYTTTGVSFSHARARYGPHFERAVRMSDATLHALVGFWRPRLPRRGLSAEVRTAFALRYVDVGSCVDMCAAFSVHSASVYRAVRDVVDTVKSSPANSAMQRGASRVGCGAWVDFSGPFAAACVATPARSFRIVDISFDSSCQRGMINTKDEEFPVLRRYSTAPKLGVLEDGLRDHLRVGPDPVAPLSVRQHWLSQIWFWFRKATKLQVAAAERAMSRYFAWSTRRRAADGVQLGAPPAFFFLEALDTSARHPLDWTRPPIHSPLAPTAATPIRPHSSLCTF